MAVVAVAIGGLGQVPFFRDGVRVEHRNARVAVEVIAVEGEQVREAVHPHCGDQPGIVDVYPRDRVRDHEMPPLLVDCGVVGEHHVKRLQPHQLLLSLGCGHPQAVALDGARADAPKLNQVLWDDAKAFALRPQDGHSVQRGGAHRVCWLDAPQEQVAIDQSGHQPRSP